MNSKRKNIVLVVFSILILFICYKYAIKKTIDYKIEYQLLKNQETLFNDLPKQFGLLNEKNKYYDSLLTKFQITETSIQNNLLKTINKAARGLKVKVIDFKEPHVFIENDTRRNSYTFTIEGSFESILKMIHQLEQKTKFGEVMNVNMEKNRRPRSRKEYLQAEIMIVNYN
ncbi:hypothetical protein GTQ40_13735 [Flavobacteriaceae bacterium R38]|nr:hypothetical protein [Flavobacteriaceae bacterium R38]